MRSACCLVVLVAGFCVSFAQQPTCGSALNALGGTSSLLTKAFGCTSLKSLLCKTFAAYQKTPPPNPKPTLDLIQVFYESNWTFDASWTNYAIQGQCNIPPCKQLHASN